MVGRSRRFSPFRIGRLIGRTLSGNIGSLEYYMGDGVVRRDDSGMDGETVLLIQGFFQTRAVMRTLEDRLRADGYRVLSFHLGGLLGNFNTRSIASLAQMIDVKIRRLQERRGFGHLHIIGHSKGGLIARYLVQRAGGHEYVRTVITLGTPHHGTPVAAIGAGVGLLLVSRSLWQLFPGSGLIRELNEEPFPQGVRLVSVYSTSDIVSPHRFSTLTVANGQDVRNVVVRELGHMDLVEDPYVYGLILRELRDRPVDSAGGPMTEFDEEVTIRRRRSR
ncbi:MAG: permease [Deltaproteobacteria bacterium]|nr:permease [Deltaproteobacteria bacterium]